MFIDKISIKNFRLFNPDEGLIIDSINIPDCTNEGSGLNVFVGENGAGKTALLDAFALPILEYKSENFSIDNFNVPTQKIEICIYSRNDFGVLGTMPNSSFNAKGFVFEAGIRARGTKAYLSSITVTDQKFIKSDPQRPKDGSPDLRLSVNNPFAGKRFSENDVVFLDKYRLSQTKSGNFNTTRFDRLMEDFSYQYIKKSDKVVDLDSQIQIEGVKNEFLQEAIAKFGQISGRTISLDKIHNFEPFKNAFFSLKKENNQQILLSNLGSGYEMIFSLLYSFYLAKQSNKQLIILIDEPELHLHPSLQEKFVQFLLEISKDAQIIITSHSPLLVKQLSSNDRVKIRIINDGNEVIDIKERVLPYFSANETNYIAFNLATEEYHNELYEELRYINGDFGIKKFDNDFLTNIKGESKDSPWMGHPNEVTMHTFIRNQIHHQRDNGKAQYDDVRRSVESLRSFF
jgi:predicted ATP-binding protein involved in virulence